METTKSLAEQYLTKEFSKRRLWMQNKENPNGFIILRNPPIKSALGLALKIVDNWYINDNHIANYYNDYEIKKEDCIDGGWMPMDNLRSKTYLSHVFGRDFKSEDNDTYISVLWGMDERNRVYRTIIMNGNDDLKLILIIDKLLDFLDSDEDFRLVSKENKLK